MPRCQATLNDVCAVQIKCTNDPDKPVDLQLWGGDEFTVFTDPEDPRQAFAVVTIDRYNQRTRYKLWFEDEVRTFLTDQYSADKTAGAGWRCRPGTGRRTPMAASPLPSFTIELRYDSSGRLDRARSCVKRNSGSMTDSVELDELISKYGRPIGVFQQCQSHFHSRNWTWPVPATLPRRNGLHRRRLRRWRRTLGRVPPSPACDRVHLGRPREVHEAGGDGGQPAVHARWSSSTTTPPRESPDHQVRAPPDPGPPAAADLPARRAGPGPQDPDRVRQPLRPRRPARAGEAAPAPARLGRAPHPDSRPRPRPVRRVGDAGGDQVAGSRSAWSGTGSITTRPSST